jgi:hypothetical protein
LRKNQRHAASGEFCVKQQVAVSVVVIGKLELDRGRRGFVAGVRLEKQARECGTGSFQELRFKRRENLVLQSEQTRSFQEPGLIVASKPGRNDVFVGKWAAASAVYAACRSALVHRPCLISRGWRYG